jgi:hypothetical protein
MRALLGDLRRRARLDGLPAGRPSTGAPGGPIRGAGRGGGVAILQRFGAALNLNVHIHALVLDGVYVEDAGGGLAFHALAAPTDESMVRVLAVVAARIRRLLERHGHGEAGPDDRAEDAWGGDAAGLAGVAAASVQGRAALGARAGARTRRIGSCGRTGSCVDTPCVHRSLRTESGSASTRAGTLRPSDAATDRAGRGMIRVHG